jgi:hypothetical protein
MAVEKDRYIDRKIKIIEAVYEKSLSLCFSEPLGVGLLLFDLEY